MHPSDLHQIRELRRIYNDLIEEIFETELRIEGNEYRLEFKMSFEGDAENIAKEKIKVSELRAEAIFLDGKINNLSHIYIK